MPLRNVRHQDLQHIWILADPPTACHSLEHLGNKLRSLPHIGAANLVMDCLQRDISAKILQLEDGRTAAQSQTEDPQHPSSTFCFETCPTAPICRDKKSSLHADALLYSACLKHCGLWSLCKCVLYAKPRLDIAFANTRVLTPSPGLLLTQGLLSVSLFPEIPLA